MGTSLEHHKTWTNFHQCGFVRCYCSFREETEGEKISRTRPKPCACTNLLFFVWIQRGGEGRERGMCSSCPLELLQGRGGKKKKCSDRCCQSGRWSRPPTRQTLSPRALQRQDGSGAQWQQSVKASASGAGSRAAEKAE
jgi:hypothetical protein